VFALESIGLRLTIALTWVRLVYDIHIVYVRTIVYHESPKIVRTWFTTTAGLTSISSCQAGAKEEERQTERTCVDRDERNERRKRRGEGTYVKGG
jgi:hypothetical protein